MKKMKSLLKRKEGFTLIELLIVLAISGVVLSVVGSFFISNYKLFYRVDAQVTVQHQAQSAMHEIVYKARGATGFIGNPTETKVVFKMNGSDNLTFEYNKSSKILYYQYGTKEKVKMAKNIEKFNMEKILDGKGASIIITTQKNDSKVEIKDNFYFRNK
jgi:prepilin-type N-terminal cleavage/methylation domain-containing protein